LSAFVLVKSLDENGEVAWAFRTSEEMNLVVTVTVALLLPFCSGLSQAAEEEARGPGVGIRFDAGTPSDIGMIPLDGGVPFAAEFNQTASLGIDPRSWRPWRGWSRASTPTPCRRTVRWGSCS
jgi:hypothetical protein